MRERFRFYEWCQSRHGGTAVLLVVATGLLVGYYAWISLIEPPPPTYKLDFGAARWIQPSQEGNDVYFRKNIYLRTVPRYAWLQVAAIDGFALFVNGKRAGITSKTALGGDLTVLSSVSGGNESIICDITHHLAPGTNTIALNVTRDSFPGRAKLLCRGGVIDSAGLSEFFSDRSWKASLTPEAIPSLIPWTDPEMSDALWPQAEEAPNIERTGLTQPVTLPPALLQKSVQGKWIVDERPASGGNTTFRKRFDAPNGSDKAWIQVAANGTYSIVLNGHFLGDFSDSSPTIQFLYLHQWIKARDNDLSIQVRAFEGLPAVIAEISFLGDDGRIDSIGSDHDWMLPGSRVANIIGAYNYSEHHWGPPPKSAIPAEVSTFERTRKQMLGMAFMFLVATATVVSWKHSGKQVPGRSDEEIERSLGIHAALHLPALVATATLLLLRYDVRFRPESPVKIEFFLGLIVLLVLPHLLLLLRRKQRFFPSVSNWDAWRAWASRYDFWVVLSVIVLAGGIMRMHGLTTFSLNQDDILIRNYAQGIFDRGYASLNFYDHVIPATTYELLPYPVALSCFLFGWTDWAVLLPAAIFGTLAILLIGLMGRSLFNSRTGLLAALIYAFNPLNVFWAQHCFHPSEDQFFALLTVWFFYLAIRQPDKLDTKYFYAASLCFCFTYLSWEGTALMLPVLAGTLLLMYPGRWGWLRQPHLWVGLIIMGSIVLIQLSMRKMVAPGFLFLGYGLALLSAPQLYFLNPESTPFYYFSSVLVTEPHLLLTILCAAGALFAGRNLAVRYCLLVFVGLLVCFSLFMPVYSIRYFYFYQFLLILTASGVFIILWDRTRELITEWRLAGFFPWAAGVAGLLLVLGTTTETGFKVFRLSENPGQSLSYSTLSARPDPSLRYDLVRQDTRRPAEFVASRLRPGDIVLADLTQAFYLYGRRLPDYALNTLLAKRMFFVSSSASYRHHFVGIPLIRNLRDMDNLFGQGRRIWCILGGELTPTEPSELKNALDLVTQRAKIVYSSSHTKVYLWDGTVTVAQQTVVNPAVPPQPALAPEKPAPLDRVVDEPDWVEIGERLSYPSTNPSNFYPQWTHQKVSEKDPASVNAEPTVRPLQPARRPEKPYGQPSP